MQYINIKQYKNIFAFNCRTSNNRISCGKGNKFYSSSYTGPEYHGKGKRTF